MSKPAISEDTAKVVKDSTGFPPITEEQVLLLSAYVHAAIEAPEAERPAAQQALCTLMKKHWYGIVQAANAGSLKMPPLLASALYLLLLKTEFNLDNIRTDNLPPPTQIPEKYIVAMDIERYAARAHEWWKPKTAVAPVSTSAEGERPTAGPSDEVGTATSKKRTRPMDSAPVGEAAEGVQEKKRKRINVVKPPDVVKRGQGLGKGGKAGLKSRARVGSDEEEPLAMAEGIHGRQTNAGKGAADRKEAGPSTALMEVDREEEVARADGNGGTAPPVKAPVSVQVNAYELAESKARVGDLIHPPVECDRCLHLGKTCLYVVGAHKRKPTHKVVMARCTGCQTAKSACSLVPRHMHDGRVFKNSIAGTAAAEWRMWVADRKAQRLPYPDLPVWNGIQGKPGSWVVDLDTWDNTDKRVSDKLMDWVAVRRSALARGQFIEPPKLDRKGDTESEPESDEEGHKAEPTSKKRSARKKAKLVGRGISPDKPIDLDEEADVINLIETPADETGGEGVVPVPEAPKRTPSHAAGKRPASSPEAAQAHQEDDVISIPDGDEQTDAFAGLIRMSPVPSSPSAAHAGPSLSVPQTSATPSVPSLSVPQTSATPSVPAPLSLQARQEAEGYIQFLATQGVATPQASFNPADAWASIILFLKYESERHAVLQARVEEVANGPAPSTGPTWSEVDKIRDELALTTGDMGQQVNQLREEVNQLHAEKAQLEGVIADISADIATMRSGVEQACTLRSDIDLVKEGTLQAMDLTLERVREIEIKIRDDINRVVRVPSAPLSPLTPVRLLTSPPSPTASEGAESVIFAPLPDSIPRPADENKAHDMLSPPAPGSLLPPLPEVDEPVEDAAPTYKRALPASRISAGAAPGWNRPTGWAMRSPAAVAYLSGSASLPERPRTLSPVSLSVEQPDVANGRTRTASTSSAARATAQEELDALWRRGKPRGHPIAPLLGGPTYNAQGSGRKRPRTGEIDEESDQLASESESKTAPDNQAGEELMDQGE